MRTKLPVLLLTITMLGAATVGAFTVNFPHRLRVGAAVIVDELGNVLFGSTPGKVEVTNFPATQTVTVTVATPQLTTLLDHVQGNSSGAVPFGPIPVDQFRELAFLGAISGSTSSLSIQFAFLAQSAGFAQPDVPSIEANGCTLNAGGGTGQTCGAIPVAGPFLAGFVAGASPGVTVTLQAYLRP
jgi:hypothetical protein